MSTVKTYNVDSGDATNLTLKTNGTTAVTVDSSQNVGIGTTSPAGRLQVNAPSTTAASLTFGATAGQILRNENSELAIGLSSSSPYPMYVQGRSNVNAARDIALQPLGGNVGIGTDSPSQKLTVAGAGTAARLEVINTSDLNRGGYLRDTGSTFELGTNSGVRPLAFAYDGSEKMRIDSNGNVGIGVTPAGTGALEIKAGTASVSPLEFNAGTNLTSANAGSVEYDGTNFYVTPTTGTTEQRGVIPSTQQFVLSAAGSAFGAAIGNFFGSNSAIQLAASTTYSIEAYCYFLKTTAGTATWAPTFSSAPTVTHATIEYTPITGFTTAIITGAMVVAEATANAVATMTFTATGSLTTAVYHVAKFKVFVTTNAATNLRFNVTQSAGTMTPQAGSWYTVRKVATNAGNFVA